ncbi:MAG: hypothetical protein LBB83_04485 [Treponema sp.]|jgi:hypothetical protein|nr:hypothetical protein [Treponema sp.]
MAADGTVTDTRSSSFFIKFFSVFLALMAVIYGIAFGMYRWGRKITAREIDQCLRRRALFGIRTLEYEIANIHQTPFE